MTIQRQYSLPNCKLVLEGLTTDTPETISARPVVSVITNVECHLAAQKPITGGREFLEHLVKAVSDYAQDYLSGISHAVRHDRRDNVNPVHLQRVEKNLHRLSIQPQASDSAQMVNGSNPEEIDLTTVQLFDLVEAIDQFLADAQTLPDLSLQLSPLPKRFIKSQEPIAKRAVPAVLGTSGLAVAALALFFIPVPEIRRIEETADSTPSPTPGSTVSPAASPTTDPDSTAASPSPVTSPATSASPSPTNAASPNPDDTGAILEVAGNISDPAELDRLTADLQGQLYDGWQQKPEPTFTQPLEYRVGVDENGQIVGYRFANDDALTYLNEIPLSDLRFPVPESPEAAAQTSIAQFLVIFRPEGVVEISPWYGLPSDAVAPTETTEPTPEQ